VSLSVYVECLECQDLLYEGNVTHNLNDMAMEAGIYYFLWRPDEIQINRANQLIRPLTKGVQLLKKDPERFKKLNPKNGWGNYEGLVSLVCEYLAACKKWPKAKISVSR